jgi:hypothetical protein
MRRGIKLTKRGKSIELYTKDDATFDGWYTAMRGLCILSNFEKNYQSIKLLRSSALYEVISACVAVLRL